jgi:hypothetical protein
MASRARAGRRLALTAVLSLAGGHLLAEQVKVRHAEGIVHGFLLLQTASGETIADGDLIQLPRGKAVESRLVFRFRDGSLYDETAVFSQKGSFRLLSNRLVQKGPSFPATVEHSIDCRSGRIHVRRQEKDDDEPEVVNERLDLPADLANGLVLTLLKNIRPDAGITVSFLAITPKPRLVKLVIAPDAQERFKLGGETKAATRFRVKVDIGGLAGLLAPLIGKDPPDSAVWILGGDAPAFVRSEQPLYFGGPLWRIELTSPVWPREANAARGAGR